MNVQLWHADSVAKLLALGVEYKFTAEELFILARRSEQAAVTFAGDVPVSDGAVAIAINAYLQRHGVTGRMREMLEVGGQAGEAELLAQTRAGGETENG